MGFLSPSLIAQLIPHYSFGLITYRDGKNDFGKPVANGVYFYTLAAGDFSATQKMLIQTISKQNSSRINLICTTFGVITVQTRA